MAKNHLHDSKMEELKIQIKRLEERELRIRRRQQRTQPYEEDIWRKEKKELLVGGTMVSWDE